ncbi:MAG: thioredoxin family protein [Sulfuricurvum sp.]|nr:thioredoxin family protein [Sulfuricurvum sp.]
MKYFSLLLISIVLSAAPVSLKNTPYHSPEASVSVVIFYTTWCPPCKRSLAMLDEMHKSHPKLFIRRVCVDEPQSQQKAFPYGLAETVPLILIADQSGTIVKRFKTLPDKTIFGDLLTRLEEGRLENGTLPIDQRLDTWKMNRKGM